MRARRALLAVVFAAALVAALAFAGVFDLERTLVALGLRDATEWSAEAPELADEELDSDDEATLPILAAGGIRPSRHRADAASAAGTASDAMPAGSSAATMGLDGTVLRAGGRPATGARVTLIASDGTTAVGVVEGDGHFHVDAARGRYDLLVRAGRDGTLFVRDVIVDGRPLDTALELLPPSEVRVEATQEERAVTGAPVRLRYAPEGAPPLVVAAGTTDGEGRFAADGLPSGPYIVEVDAVAGVTATRRGDVSGSATFPFRLPALARWTGRVTDAETGAPVAAEVSAAVGMGGGTSARAATVSDSNGVFALVVPRGRPQQVLVENPAYAPFPSASEWGSVSAALAALRNADVQRDVALSRGASVRGTVTNADSKAPSGSLALRFLPGRGASVRTATTASDGTYEARGLSAGDWNVVVETEGWYAIGKTSVRIPPPSSASTEPLQHDLTVRASGRVAGRVEKPDGAPVARAHVWLVGGGGILRSARDAGRALETFTAIDGQFVLEDVPPVDVRVRASLGDVEATPSAPIRVADGTPPLLVLVLQPTGTIRGRVIDAHTRDPVEGARVRLDSTGEPGGRGGRTVTTGADGRFEAPGLLPGGWSLVPSRRRDFLPAEPTSITLSTDALSIEVALALDPGHVIAGTVVGEEGNAIAGARVVLSGVEDVGSPPAQVGRNVGSGGDGSFRLTGLRAGTYAIDVRSSGGLRGRVDRLRGGESRVVIVVKRPPP